MSYPRTVSPSYRFFGPLQGIPVWLMQVTDPSYSQVVQFAPYHSEVIEEWWLTPLGGPTWSEEQIATTNQSSLTDLASSLVNEDGANYRTLERIQMCILDRSWRKTYRTECVWEVVVRDIEDVGQVLSVIYGTSRAMQGFRDWQTRQTATISK